MILIYNSSRLKTFEEWSTLLAFSKARAANYGVATYFPIQAVYKNKTSAAIYPGDDLYPCDPDMTGENANVPKVIDMKHTTLEECRAQRQHLNRMEMRGPHETKIVCNIVDPNGHVKL